MPTRSHLSGRPSWRISSVRSSGLGPNWSPSSLVARSHGAKNGKSDMSSYLRDTTLVSLPCGCAETPHTEHGQEMALHEMKKGHLFGWVEKQHVSLTDQQINELAQYGIEISKDEKIVVYYSMTARRGRSEVAKAFPVKGEGEHGLFELVVDVGR